MNPFSHLGKSLANSRQSDNVQPTTNPNTGALSRNEPSNSSIPFNLLQLPSSHYQGLNSLSRCPALHESYNLPTKRVRHTLENFSEAPHELQTTPNQNSAGKRLEALLQPRIQPKTSDEDARGQNAGSRRAQSLIISEQRENNPLGKNSDIRDPSNILIAKQYMNMYKKEMLARENINNQNPLSPNDALYALLSNNFNLPGLLPNTLNMSNPLVIELLRQLEAQQAMQQFSQYLQLNQQLHSLQESFKQNNNLRTSLSREANTPKIHIPPLASINSSDRSHQFVETTILSPIPLSEARENHQGVLNLKGAFKLSSPKQNTFEKAQRSQKGDERNQKEAEKMDKQYKVEVISLQGQLGKGDQNKNIIAEEEKETESSSQVEPEAQSFAPTKRKDSSQRILASKPTTQNSSTRDSRKKNRWQMLIEKDEEVDNSALTSSENDQKVSRFSQRGKSLKKNPSNSQSLDWGDLKENRDINAETRSSKTNTHGTSTQKAKKKQNLSVNQKINMKLDLLKNQLEALVQEEGPRQRKLSIMSSLHDPSESNVPSTSFNSPTNDDSEQKEHEPIYTRVGKNYQPIISVLDINAQGQSQRSPRLLWDPEAIDPASLAVYFDKLQAILGCKGVNDEKAIRMLIKKNLVQEEVIVTIKKNEKFYSNFLGTPFPEKEVKSKKGSEDIK